MENAKEGGSVQYICGDNLEVLKGYSDNYFHSIVTDPP